VAWKDRAPRATGSRARHIAKAITPHGFVVWREHRFVELRDAEQAEALERAATGPTPGYSHDAAARFLIDRGLAGEAVRDGSIPEPSLDFAGGRLRDRLPRDRPLRMLHVGNFVGMSLAYFTALARELHEDSVVVSIDPNIRHQRVADPQSHVLALLGHFGLLANSIVIPGYTLEQNLGDPLPGASADRYLDERACERVLEGLGRLESRGFDFVMLDGNHDSAYLRREFAALRPLLAERAIVCFDDVSESWPGVQAVFREVVDAAGEGVAELGGDGRVALVQTGGRGAAQ
jgi:Methyltransferase domain